ncbi:hypothetical protein D9611_001032 [Ephemerocybe angulata]|uniref:Uncharacterized protein n=1 Tax=Ephemerocybe angulata TaxID=980116 RepID=A0A8H5F6U8_9AGAR|nr:hypothetical protein D9611_001032 [Tulosesus angulatus]
MAPTGEPKPSPKPEPIGSMAWVSLITICTLCGLFILWRRADALRKVVARRILVPHPLSFTARRVYNDNTSLPSTAPSQNKQKRANINTSPPRFNLKPLGSQSEGRIRLSEDDGPPSAEFLWNGDEYDDDNTHLDTVDPSARELSDHIKRATNAWREPNIAPLQSHDQPTASASSIPPTTPDPSSQDNAIIRL